MHMLATLLAASAALVPSARLPPLRTSAPATVSNRASVHTLRGGAAAGEASASVLASALGWGLTAGAMAIYTPMIATTLAKKNADGMSVSTWSLNLSGFLIFVVYHIRNGYSLSTFLDFAALGLQL